MGIFRTRAKKELPAIFPNDAKVEKKGVSELDQSVGNLTDVISGLEGGESLAVDKKSQGNEPRFKSKKNSLLWNFLRLFVPRRKLTALYYKHFEDKRKDPTKRITTGLSGINDRLETLQTQLSAADTRSAALNTYDSLGVKELIDNVKKLGIGASPSESNTEVTIEKKDEEEVKPEKGSIEHNLHKYLQSDDNQHIEELIEQLKRLKGLCDKLEKAREGAIDASQKESGKEQADSDKSSTAVADKQTQASIKEDKKLVRDDGDVSQLHSQVLSKEEQQRNIQDLRSAYSELELEDDESVFGTLFENEGSLGDATEKQGTDVTTKSQHRLEQADLVKKESKDKQPTKQSQSVGSSDVSRRNVLSKSQSQVSKTAHNEPLDPPEEKVVRLKNEVRIRIRVPAEGKENRRDASLNQATMDEIRSRLKRKGHILSRSLFKVAQYICDNEDRFSKEAVDNAGGFLQIGGSLRGLSQIRDKKRRRDLEERVVGLVFDCMEIVE